MNRDHKIIRASPEGLAARALGKTLNRAFIERVSSTIYATWQQIAGDALQLGRVSNPGAIELCIDADRLWFGTSTRGKAFEEAVLADEAIAGAIAAHGYPKVLRYLNRHIRLL